MGYLILYLLKTVLSMLHCLNFPVIFTNDILSRCLFSLDQVSCAEEEITYFLQIEVREMTRDCTKGNMCRRTSSS